MKLRIEVYEDNGYMSMPFILHSAHFHGLVLSTRHRVYNFVLIITRERVCFQGRIDLAKNCFYLFCDWVKGHTARWNNIPKTPDGV